ncbi:MAG: hypothetical protein WCI18_04595 [Pseudomonadota bacterium]
MATIKNLRYVSNQRRKFCFLRVALADSSLSRTPPENIGMTGEWVHQLGMLSLSKQQDAVAS